MYQIDDRVILIDHNEQYSVGTITHILSDDHYRLMLEESTHYPAGLQKGDYYNAPSSSLEPYHKKKKTNRKFYEIYNEHLPKILLFCFLASCYCLHQYIMETIPPSMLEFYLSNIQLAKVALGIGFLGVILKRIMN